MLLLALTMLLISPVTSAADARQAAERTRLASISIEDVDARATIAGCLAREAAARNRRQPDAANPAVRAEIERQAKDPQRLEQCRRVLATD